MEDYIIVEDCILPSKGKIYNKAVNPELKIRSMTTNEEMKRLAHTELPFKMLPTIIDDCLTVKPGISSYDMCLGDYQYLLYRLRIATYGSDYPVDVKCPYCGQTHKETIDLEKLGVIEYKEEMGNLFNITLPLSKKQIKLRLQTPRMMDEIVRRTKEIRQKGSSESEPAFLLNVKSNIAEVDGKVLDDIKLEQFVRSLPMRDTNYLLKSIDKLNIGLDLNVEFTCPSCGKTFKDMLPFTGEFFGPSID